MTTATDDERPCSVALVLIDVVNGFDFEGSERLARDAEEAAPKIRALREAAHRASVPVIYVNDNFGRWRSDFHAIVAGCSAPGQPGRNVSRLLAPGERDYFVLKPRHSGFYGTALELLLERLRVETLVLVGFATNICVLYTASDAHMRGYDVIVPSDGTASNTPELTHQALEHMRLVSGARVVEAASLRFEELAGRQCER